MGAVGGGWEGTGTQTLNLDLFSFYSDSSFSPLATELLCEDYYIGAVNKMRFVIVCKRSVLLCFNRSFKMKSCL